jgi:hypothetical protein
MRVALVRWHQLNVPWLVILGNSPLTEAAICSLKNLGMQLQKLLKRQGSAVRCTSMQCWCCASCTAFGFTTELPYL